MMAPKQFLWQTVKTQIEMLHQGLHCFQSQKLISEKEMFYFITSSDFNAYLKQIKLVFSQS